MTKHLFIDATFHHPDKYSQLLIIIFKDIIISEYLPAFFILMSNKTEILYNQIFCSVKRILTQNNIYNLNIETITTDSEIGLINAINNNFPNSQRIGCLFHLKQDLMREAKTLGLLNSKNNKINIETTLEVITQLSLLPIEYNGDIKYLETKIKILSSQYPIYSNMINGYFLDTKLKYFKDGSYNYNNFPKDIRSNSILERYNKTVKTCLGAKRTCNWVIFINFINNEINRIDEELAKNENVNVLYEIKNTKFGIEKYAPNIRNNNKKDEIIPLNEEKSKVLNISDKWLTQKGNNCRYNAFITLFYFTISSSLEKIEDNNLKLLNGLNKLILKLSEEINEKNYYDIIIFLQKNKFDSNNLKIDEILNERDETKKEILIQNLKIDDAIDFSSSGYVVQLFSIFNNSQYFCIKENKSIECFICGIKKVEEIKDMQPFIFINNTNISEKSIFNLLLSKYKENYSYACDCRKNLPKSEDVLCLKIKYNIISYPLFIFLLFDFEYPELSSFENNIFKLVEEKLVLNFKEEYKLLGLIAVPKRNHYNTIIFNPIGQNINNKFTQNKIYYHDGMKNGGQIVELKEGEDWKEIGIPYIVVYKKYEVE